MLWANFIESLKLMAMGMTGIFVFIMVFYALAALLMKLFPYQDAGEDL